MSIEIYEVRLKSWPLPRRGWLRFMHVFPSATKSHLRRRPFPAALETGQSTSFRHCSICSSNV